MFDNGPFHPARIAPQDMRTVCPIITPRPATRDELLALSPWLRLQGMRTDAAEVTVFADGTTRHAPETIAAYRALARRAPAGFGLLYLHAGVQVQSLDPLLPGLLHLTAHQGPFHALRRPEIASGAADPSISALVRAMTPASGATLIIDDPQSRIAAPGASPSCPVHLRLYRADPAQGIPS